MYISALKPRNIKIKAIVCDIVVLALSFFEKKLSFQSNGSGLVVANAIREFLSIFGTNSQAYSSQQRHR